MRFSSFPLLTSALLLLALCQTRVAWSRVDTLRTFPEKRFVNGVMSLGQYLSKNLRYPLQAQQASTVGTSLVSFLITPTGELTHVAIVNSLGKAVDGEVRRVVESTGKLWMPADQPDSQDSLMLFLSVEFSLGNTHPYREEARPDFILPEIIVVGYNPSVSFSIRDDAYYINQLTVASQKKDYKQMLTMVNELIRRNPYSDKLYLQRANIEQALGQQGEACSDYKKIIYFLGRTSFPKKFLQNCP